jgi:hypothetical protein
MMIFEHAAQGVAYLRTMAKRDKAQKIVMTFPFTKCECGPNAAMLIIATWETHIGEGKRQEVKICAQCAQK